MTPILELSQVTKVHGEGRLRVQAISDVDLIAEQGQLIAVMGPSGSGKTTLLTLAGGLDRVTSGDIAVCGQWFSKKPQRELVGIRRKLIGYVFQQFNLVAGLTALENVALPLELEGIGRADCLAESVSALQRVGLLEMASRFPEELSGGEQQRVAIARGMVGRRPLILADEPTGALDSVTAEGVLRLLRSHCDSGGTVVMVTHNPQFAAFADEVVFLRDGRLIDRTSGRRLPESLLQSHPVS